MFLSQYRYVTVIQSHYFYLANSSLVESGCKHYQRFLTNYQLCRYRHTRTHLPDPGKDSGDVPVWWERPRQKPAKVCRYHLLLFTEHIPYTTNIDKIKLVFTARSRKSNSEINRRLCFGQLEKQSFCLASLYHSLTSYLVPQLNTISCTTA